MLETFLKFCQIVKVDEAAHMVYGIVTSEAPDSDDEICDYSTAKEEIKKWSDDQLAKTIAAGQDPSLGNMRVMHQLQVGGKAVKIECKDDTKQIWVGSEPADEEVWHLLKGGFLTMHSIGGGYLWKKQEGKYTRYGPRFSEISYVDKGANPDASFAYVKADGTTELRKFAKPGPDELATLHKIELSALNTQLAKISAQVSDLVRQPIAAGADMNKEQIAKCAAALGITVEEFTKQFVEGEALEKGKHGLAALHAHLKKAVAHHAKLSDFHKRHAAMHKEHAEHHATMGEHLDNAMKAHAACMDGDESEKVLKALLEGIKAPVVEPAKPETFTKAEAEKMVANAIEKANKELEEKLKIRVIPRGSGEKLTEEETAKVAKSAAAGTAF